MSFIQKELASKTHLHKKSVAARISRNYRRLYANKPAKKYVKEAAVKAYLKRQQEFKQWVEWNKWRKEIVGSSSDDVQEEKQLKTVRQLRIEQQQKMKALKDARTARTQNVTAAINTTK